MFSADRGFKISLREQNMKVGQFKVSRNDSGYHVYNNQPRKIVWPQDCLSGTFFVSNKEVSQRKGIF